MRVVTCNNGSFQEAEALRAMFAARKSVFIDLLKWEIPALEERYEIDQYDTPHARYLIALHDDARHAASARLLPTTRPHILDTLFSHLSDEPLPQGPAVREITRFCLDRDQHRPERRVARNLLITVLVDFAVAEAITTYTGVAEIGWFQQFCLFGWSCRALGRLQSCGAKPLIAFRIDIDDQTIDHMIATGIYIRSAHCVAGLTA